MFYYIYTLMYIKKALMLLISVKLNLRRTSANVTIFIRNVITFIFFRSEKEVIHAEVLQRYVVGE